MPRNICHAPNVRPKQYQPTICTAVGAYGIRPAHRRPSRAANLYRNIANPRNSGVCHTPLRRCCLLIDCCSCICAADGIRNYTPLFSRIGYGFPCIKCSFGNFCFAPFVGAYGIRPVHCRTSRATNLYRDIANPRNPGVCHTPLRRCIFLIDCCLCIFVAYCIRPLHRRVKRFVQQGNNSHQRRKIHEHTHISSRTKNENVKTAGPEYEFYVDSACWQRFFHDKTAARTFRCGCGAGCKRNNSV